MNREVIKESVRKSLESKKRNQELREKAVKACKEINTENPIAAAEAMPGLLIAAKGALAALTQNKTFPADIAAAKKWLSEAIARIEAKE